MAESSGSWIYKKHYRINKKLSIGKSDATYLVTDIKSKNEQKILKVIRLNELDSEQTANYVYEVGLLSSLNNEFIVKFHESFLENNCLCIVTEFCEDGNLEQKLKELKIQNHALEEDQVIEWLIQILIAIQYMHKFKILHQNLKARNIFLKSNKIKIGDFGISRISVGNMDVATKLTRTPCYLSPEVLKNDEYELKSDIWSVGCLLYEMCTYKHAFDGKSLMDIVHNVVEGKSPVLPIIYSKQLNDLLQKMFIKDPRKRLSADELLQDRFIIKECERCKINIILEITFNNKPISESNNILSEKSINNDQIQKQNCSLHSQSQIIDDNKNVQSENTLSNLLHNKKENEEEDEKILNTDKTQKAAKQRLIEKKIQEADVRGQLFREAIQSHAIEAKQNQQKLHGDIFGIIKYSQTLLNDKEKQQTHGKLAQPFNNHIRNQNQFCNRAIHSSSVIDINKQFPYNSISRPVTFIRSVNRQICNQLNNEDNQPYNDYKSTNDHSLTHEKQSDEINMTQQHSTMNQTTDPDYTFNSTRQTKNILPLKDLGKAPKQEASLNKLIDDSDKSFGSLAKFLKINILRTRARHLLGESTFEKVYNYLVKQRTAQKTDPNLDDATITQGLTAFVKKPSDCFLVEQLVFLELYK